MVMEDMIAMFMIGFGVGGFSFYGLYLHDERSKRKERQRLADQMIAEREEEKAREYFQRSTDRRPLLRRPPDPRLADGRRVGPRLQRSRSRACASDRQGADRYFRRPPTRIVWDDLQPLRAGRQPRSRCGQRTRYHRLGLHRRDHRYDGQPGDQALPNRGW